MKKKKKKKKHCQHLLSGCFSFTRDQMEHFKKETLNLKKCQLCQYKFSLYKAERASWLLRSLSVNVRWRYLRADVCRGNECVLFDWLRESRCNDWWGAASALCGWCLGRECVECAYIMAAIPAELVDPVDAGGGWREVAGSELASDSAALRFPNVNSAGFITGRLPRRPDPAALLNGRRSAKGMMLGSVPFVVVMGDARCGWSGRSLDKCAYFGGWRRWWWPEWPWREALDQLLCWFAAKHTGRKTRTD